MAKLTEGEKEQVSDAVDALDALYLVEAADEDLAILRLAQDVLEEWLEESA